VQQARGQSRHVPLSVFVLFVHMSSSHVHLSLEISMIHVAAKPRGSLVVKIELHCDPVNTTSDNGGYHKLQRKLVQHFQPLSVSNSNATGSIVCVNVDVGKQYHHDCQDDAD
jgi:hypothetical protein